MVNWVADAEDIDPDDRRWNLRPVQNTHCRVSLPNQYSYTPIADHSPQHCLLVSYYYEPPTFTSQMTLGRNRVYNKTL